MSHKSKVVAKMYCVCSCRMRRKEGIRNRDVDQPHPFEDHREVSKGLEGSCSPRLAQSPRWLVHGPWFLQKSHTPARDQLLLHLLPASQACCEFPIPWCTKFWEGRSGAGFILGCRFHLKGSESVHYLLKARCGGGTMLYKEDWYMIPGSK